MTAVTASTNMERPKIVLAGVDAGAKMFVDLNGELDVAAQAAAVKYDNNATMAIALRVAGFRWCRILHAKRAVSAADCLMPGTLTQCKKTAGIEWKYKAPPQACGFVEATRNRDLVQPRLAVPGCMSNTFGWLILQRDRSRTFGVDVEIRDTGVQ